MVLGVPHARYERSGLKGRGQAMARVWERILGCGLDFKSRDRALACAVGSRAFVGL